MAKSSGRYRKTSAENRKKKINSIIWIVLIVIIVGGAWMLISKLLAITSEDALRLSYPRSYSAYVAKYSAKYKLEPSLVYAVIRTESGFDPDAESNVGACGLMQIMPSSFEWMTQKRGENRSADELFNPETNIDYGCWLLSYFLDYYENETCAVAAYNAGFVVSDWLENPEYSDDGVTLQAIPYPETDTYVERVEDAKKMYIQIYYS